MRAKRADFGRRLVPTREPVAPELAHRVDDREERLALLRQLVLDARRRLRIAATLDNPLVFERAQALGKRSRRDPGARVLELGEPARAFREIVDEGRQLVEQGIKEITLLGQIVTSYGKRDIPVRDGKSAFVQLLEAVHEIRKKIKALRALLRLVRDAVPRSDLFLLSDPEMAKRFHKRASAEAEALEALVSERQCFLP